jgi:hypothetical protein
LRGRASFDAAGRSRQNSDRTFPRLAARSRTVRYYCLSNIVGL